MEGWGHKVGLGRPGEPSEVATSFIFLASADASLYCEWSNIPVAVVPRFFWSLFFFLTHLLPLDGQILCCYPLGD